jgi:hypothetical protein
MLLQLTTRGAATVTYIAYYTDFFHVSNAEAVGSLDCLRLTVCNIIALARRRIFGTI